MGIADSYGIERRHPIREWRRAGQIERKVISNHRRMVGGKLCAIVKQCDGQMIALADREVHRAAEDSANVLICRRGQWNVRMTVETVFAMLSVKWDLRRRVIGRGKDSRRIWPMRWRGSAFCRNGMR